MSTAMPRPKGKARTIAYEILGKPSPFRQKKTEKEKELDEKLVYDDIRYQR